MSCRLIPNTAQDLPLWDVFSRVQRVSDTGEICRDPSDGGGDQHGKLFGWGPVAASGHEMHEGGREEKAMRQHPLHHAVPPG
jgi:hypothetical protein